MVDISADDADSASIHLAETEAILEVAPHSPPPQLLAMVAVAQGGLAILHGELDEAARYLRGATSRAIASHDQPIIGMVAVSLGTLALARGDIRSALDAVDLSTALIGAYDATNPQIMSIEAAALNAGIGRSNTAFAELDRPKALEELKKLVD
jgi:hypothetical protein